MENKLGRTLTFNEIVHHKNGDKKCNEDNNLEVMSRSEHGKLHMKKRTPSRRSIDALSKYWKDKPRFNQAKFTYTEVQKIKLLRESGQTYRQIATRFNADHTTIINMLNGKTLCYRHMLSNTEPEDKP